MGINLAGLGSVPLVIAAALALAGLSPRLRARGGDAARLVALSLVLCGLVLGTGVSALASTGGVGFDQEIYTFFRRPPDLVIGVDLRLDPIAAIVAAVVLIAALCDALAQIVRGGAWAGALRLSIAVSGALAVSLGRSLLVIGVGWLAVAIACRFGQARARLASAGALLWFALVGAFVAAASLDVLAIERVGIAGRSGAFVRGALLGAPLAVTVGAALVGVAALVGRVGPERDEGPLFSPVELLLAIVALLRVNTIFALSPGLGAALVLGGLGVAIAAGLPDRNDARARLGSVHGGLAIAAAGLAAWDAALLLALGSALAGVGLRLARSSEGPWTSRISRALASGAAPGGVAIGIAGLVVAGCTHHSALGSLAAWIVPAGALAASLVAGYVASGASPGRDCSDPAVARGLAWALWLPSFGVVALALPLAAGAPIARFLGPIIAMSRSLEGLPTGPRVEAMSSPLAGPVGLALALALVMLSAGAGHWLAARGRGGALERAGAALSALLNKMSRWAGLSLDALGGLCTLADRRPGPRPWYARLGEVVARSQEGPVGATLLMVTLGAALLLAHVFANPDAATLGPSRVHPVDLGGLAPKMARPASRANPRPRAPEPITPEEEAAANAAREQPERAPEGDPPALSGGAP